MLWWRLQQGRWWRLEMHWRWRRLSPRTDSSQRLVSVPDFVISPWQKHHFKVLQWVHSSVLSPRSAAADPSVVFAAASSWHITSSVREESVMRNRKEDVLHLTAEEVLLSSLQVLYFTKDWHICLRWKQPLFPTVTRQHWRLVPINVSHYLHLSVA